MTEITIPRTVKYVYKNAFAGSAIKQVYVESGCRVRVQDIVEANVRVEVLISPTI